MPSAGRPFHCLQATSHALQPMHRVESVKKPMGSCLGGAGINFILFHRPGVTSSSMMLILGVGPLHIQFLKIGTPSAFVKAHDKDIVEFTVDCGLIPGLFEIATASQRHRGVAIYRDRLIVR